MINTKNCLRGLLTSTSILTLVFSNINDSKGATQINQNNPSSLTTNSDWNSGPFVSGDSIKFGGNHQIILNQPNYKVDFIDTNGYSGGKITAQTATMLGSASSIGAAGSGTGATFIEFDNNTELFLISNYSAVTSITPTAALGSGNGIVNFGIVSDNTQNITLGTPDLKLNTISSMGVIDTGMSYNFNSIRTIFKQGKEIYATEYQLSPFTV